MARFWSFLAICGLVVGGSGCVHSSKPLIARGPVPAEVDLAQVLRDLAAQSAALQNFDAKGVKVLVRGPGLEAEQLLPQSRVFYRSPAELHVIGRKFGGKTYAQITVAQDTFLLNLPVQHEFFLRRPNQSFSAALPQARPGDVVRELFVPEDWAALDPAKLTVQAGEEPGTFVLSHTTGEGLTREFVVKQLEGKWVLSESRLLHLDELIARTRRDAYQPLGEILFPFSLGIEFPGENAAIHFTFGSVALAAPSDTRVFDVQDQIQQLEGQGFRELQPFQE